jgi:hypothetical protein
MPQLVYAGECDSYHLPLSPDLLYLSCSKPNFETGRRRAVS